MIQWIDSVGQYIHANYPLAAILIYAFAVMFGVCAPLWVALTAAWLFDKLTK